MSTHLVTAWSLGRTRKAVLECDGWLETRAMVHTMHTWDWVCSVEVVKQRRPSRWGKSRDLARKVVGLPPEEPTGVRA